MAKFFGGDIIFPASDDLPYDEAVKCLNKERREYILDKVYEKRLEKSEIINNI